jgi:transposase
MKHSVGLDVSVKETAICIIDELGNVVRETKVVTEPEAIIAS